MKRILLTILLAALGTAIFGISGHITQDTTWETDQIVTGALYIDEGVTLTIMPGVHVTFPRIDQNADGIGDIYIEVSGRLLVQGTPTNKVFFTSNQTNPASSDWLGIKYITPQSGLLTTISNAEILYAHESLFVNGRNITLSNLRIAYSGDYGMRIANSVLTTNLTNCTIEENLGYGLLIEAGTINISGLILSHNGSYGLKLLADSIVAVTDLISSTNANHGIWVIDDADASFTNSRSISNGENGVHLENCTVNFNNCNISNNLNYGVNFSGSSGQPSFSYCTINSNRFGVYLQNRPLLFHHCNIENNIDYGIYIHDASPIINFCNLTLNGNHTNSIPSSMQTMYPTNWITPNGGGIEYLPIDAFDQMGPDDGLPKLIVWLQYRKDADNSWVNGHTQALDTRIVVNQINMLEHWYRNDHISWNDMPEITVEGPINQHIYNNTDIGIDLFYQVFCANPRAWVHEFNYFCIQRVDCNVANLSPNVIADIQFNWWDDVQFVDSNIAQCYANTANYNGPATSRISNAGSTLANLSPSLDLLTPQGMVINPSAYDILWSDNDLDDDATIALYYTADPSQTGTLIADNISEDSNINSYNWNLAGMAPGTYYIIAVINDGVNSPVTAISPGRIMIGVLEIKMPANATGVAGTTVEIPVLTYNTVDYYNILSFQFTLVFNSSIIQATGINTDGTLTAENWTVYANTSTPGQISVNGFSTQTLNSSGELVKLVFNVQPGAINYSTSPLNFADCVLNNGSPEPLLTDGLLRVVNQYSISGNVNYYLGASVPVPDVTLTLSGDQTYQTESADNGHFNFPPCYAGNYVLTPSCSNPVSGLVVTPYDAALTAQFALGLYAFNTNQQKAADVNGDNQATVYDAALIAQYSVGLIDSFTPGAWGFSPPNQSYNLVSNFTNVQFLAYAIGDPSGNWDPQQNPDQSEIPINLTARSGEIIDLPISWERSFSAGYLQLSYDPVQLRYLGTEYAAALDEMQRYSKAEDGILRIAVFGVEPVTSTDQVFNPRFEVINGDLTSSSDLCLVSLQFDEQDVDLSPVLIIPDIMPNTPPTLYQNYPNPFNPLTSISYSISKDTRVRITLFNLRGEAVKELVNEVKTPGIHTVSLDAANLASGIYFYRMDSGQGSQVRKMVLLK